MTKKQVRKLSLEHSNMAPHVKRKPKTVSLLALKDLSHVCLYRRTKHLQESSSTGYSGAGRRVLCLFTLPCCMNILPTQKIKCKSKVIGKGKKIAHRFHYSLLIISCISIFSAQKRCILRYLHYLNIKVFVKIKLKGCRFKQSKKRWQKRKVLYITIMNQELTTKEGTGPGWTPSCCPLLEHLLPTLNTSCVTTTETYLYSVFMWKLVIITEGLQIINKYSSLNFYLPNSLKAWHIMECFICSTLKWRIFYENKIKNLEST